jgi:hypothetical protein
MGKHLIMYSTSILDLETPMLEIGHWEYLKKRLQPWKWRLKHTMGRPVLILWKTPRKEVTRE